MLEAALPLLLYAQRKGIFALYPAKRVNSSGTRWQLPVRSVAQHDGDLPTGAICRICLFHVELVCSEASRNVMIWLILRGSYIRY
ncbi:hypothetical protein [Paenibacillus bouchesdurhonensis]|uniref:hypothetical protein n=1 Tax=Paenibacillus bouchesdurhonensis TaxID=1870990 RepID=UPI000DA61973|nr:hypothetical protein [Paenibacillus bouchesdurhonensis]